MIMVGKVFIALIWTFWVLISGSVAEGKPSDQGGISEPIKE